MKTFTVKTEYANYPNCRLRMEKYADNNHIALQVFSDEEGPIATLTVNLPAVNKYKEVYSFVDTNNFPEAIELINQLGIGKDAGFWSLSGFCAYPLYKFNIKKIREWL